MATLDTLPEHTEAAREILNLEDGQSWRDGDEIFFLVRTEAGENTGTDLARVSGTVRVGDDGPSNSIPSHRPRRQRWQKKSKWDCTAVTKAALTAHALTGRLPAWASEALAWDNSW